MSNMPPQAVIDAINAGIAQITRRIEICESDGVTPWVPTEDESVSLQRLVDGSVSIDYERDERRTVDITLRNDDNALRPDPYDGIWYDKVFKLFKGIRYRNVSDVPTIVIVEEAASGTGANSAIGMRRLLLQLGYSKIDINLNATSYDDVANYDMIVSHRANLAVTKTTLLNTCYLMGKQVVTTGNDSTVALDVIGGTVAIGTAGAYNIAPVNYDIPIEKSWSTENGGTDTGTLPVTMGPGAVGIATATINGNIGYTAILGESVNEGRWFHYHASTIGTEGKKLWRTALRWVRNFQEYLEWETQLGEFLADNLSEDHFPYQVKMVGRDYTKRCINSKTGRAVAFEAGEGVRAIIRALAANSGITKFKLPNLNGLTLANRVDYAAGTSRWEIMKTIANAYNYDIYFDNEGYLTMSEYQDPSSSAYIARFSTGGDDGNLVSLTRSTNDSELYNHIVVTSDAENEDGSPPFFGEARNTDSSSPTNVDRIGERTFFWTSAALESDEACAKLARSWLKIYALESYETSGDVISYPWMDVGFIVEVLDPRRIDTDPTNYFLSSVTLPAGLGPMSFTARRLTIIADDPEEAAA